MNGFIRTIELIPTRRARSAILNADLTADLPVQIRTNLHEIAPGPLPRRCRAIRLSTHLPAISTSLARGLNLVAGISQSRWQRASAQRRVLGSFRSARGFIQARQVRRSRSVRGLGLPLPGRPGAARRDLCVCSRISSCTRSASAILSLESRPGRRPSPPRAIPTNIARTSALLPLTTRSMHRGIGRSTGLFRFSKLLKMSGFSGSTPGCAATSRARSPASSFGFLFGQESEALLVVVISRPPRRTI